MKKQHDKSLVALRISVKDGILQITANLPWGASRVVAVLALLATLGYPIVPVLIGILQKFLPK